MPESELLRTFMEAFEAGNAAWNAGDVKRALNDQGEALESAGLAAPAGSDAE